jgi:hypothetical protein
MCKPIKMKARVDYGIVMFYAFPHVHGIPGEIWFAQNKSPAFRFYTTLAHMPHQLSCWATYICQFIAGTVFQHDFSPSWFTQPYCRTLVPVSSHLLELLQNNTIDVIIQIVRCWRGKLGGGMVSHML